MKHYLNDGMNESLKLTGIAKRYGASQNVLSGLNYEFKPGTATGLVGENGSGKTTLLRLLSVTAFPTSGTITYGSINIHETPYEYLQSVGLVNDSSDLPQDLTAVELLEWILRGRKRWDETSQSEIVGLLDRLYLDERRHNLIGTYSSGMIKKTQIALSLIVAPTILLMDEPFRGLDDATQKTVLVQLQEFRNKGGILVVSSHMKSILETLCDDFLNLPIRA